MQPQPSTDDRTECDALQRLSGLPTHHRRPTPDSRHVLARAIEQDVIPRLLAARRPAIQNQPAGTPTEANLASLVALILADDQPAAIALVDTLHHAGIPADALLLDLLAAAARRLGAMWEDDTASFSAVTLGMLHLGTLMRRLDDAACQAQPAPASHTVLLAQMPGEQHGFGLAMLAQFFRRAGWNTRVAPAPTTADLLAQLTTQDFGLVGISVACNDNLAALADTIRAIRARSHNRRIAIMVGGQPFLVHPQLASMVGADATAADARQAVQEAARLVARQARQR